MRYGTIVISELSYLAFLLTIFLPKLSYSHNQQLLSKGTKFQTSSYSNFHLVFYLHIYTSADAWVKKEEHL